MFLFNCFKTGLKFATIAFIVASVLAFLGAPTFLGVVFITASVVMTVYAYAVLAFLLGFIFKYFKKPKNAEVPGNN